MTRHLFLLLAVVLLPALNLQSAAGEGEALITVDGSASVSRMPDTLRMKLDVISQGKDRADAIAKLSKRELLSKLTDIGVDSGKVKLGETVEMTSRFVVKQYTSTGQPPAVGGSQLPVPAPQGGAGQPPGSGLPLPPQFGPTPYTRSVPTMPIVGFSVVADIAMGKTNDETAAAARSLQERIEAMDLGGLGGLAEGTACETCGPKAGTPYFTYVSKPSNDEQAAIYREAFLSAQKVAERWAIAAGGKLGPVHSIVQTTTKPSAAISPTLAPPFDRNHSLQLPIKADAEETPGAGLEVSAPAISPVEHRVKVTVAFEMQTNTRQAE